MPKYVRHKINGYAGIYYIMGKAVATGRPERIYYVMYRKNGKLIDEKVGRQHQNNMTPAKAARIRTNRIEGRDLSNTERRAEALEADSAALEADAAEEARWTINKLWDLYCENNASNKSLKNEKIKYEKSLRPDLGQREPGELVPLDVDRIRLKWQKAGKMTMAARVLELLRRTISYGVKRGLVPPINFKVEVPRLNNQTTEDLAPEQIKELMEVLEADEDQTAANVMRLALFTGMRRSEIFKLRWDAIDFRRGFITLQNPKGGQDQSIPLNDAARAVFESIVQDDENPFVFPGRFPGKHLTDRRVSFARIAKAAGFPPKFRPIHGLRHVFASQLASSGQVDMHVLQRLMTHKTPMMTQRYAHLRDDVLKQASQLAGQLAVDFAADTKKVINLTEKN